MKVIISVLIVVFSRSFSVSAQDNYPVFNYASFVDSSSNQLTEFMVSNFHNGFLKYFPNSCGISYHLVYFTVKPDGKVHVTGFDTDSTLATAFIGNTIKATSGKWSFKGKAEKETNMVLPVYLFLYECERHTKNIPFLTVNVENPDYKGLLKKKMYGYEIQDVRDDTLILWPIKLFTGIDEPNRSKPHKVDMQIVPKNKY